MNMIEEGKCISGIRKKGSAIYKFWENKKKSLDSQKEYIELLALPNNNM